MGVNASSLLNPGGQEATWQAYVFSIYEDRALIIRSQQNNIGYSPMVLVLDFSGSMYHSYELLRKIGQTALDAGLVVVCFANDAILSEPGQTLSTTDGCTNYSAVLELLLKKEVVTADTTIMFFTDGVPNMGQEKQDGLIDRVHGILAQGPGSMISIYLSNYTPTEETKRQMEQLCSSGQKAKYIRGQELETTIRNGFAASLQTVATGNKVQVGAFAVHVADPKQWHEGSKDVCLIAKDQVPTAMGVAAAIIAFLERNGQGLPVLDILRNLNKFLSRFSGREGYGVMKLIDAVREAAVNHGTSKNQGLSLLLAAASAATTVDHSQHGVNLVELLHHARVAASNNPTEHAVQAAKVRKAQQKALSRSGNTAEKINKAVNEVAQPVVDLFNRKEPVTAIRFHISAELKQQLALLADPTQKPEDLQSATAAISHPGGIEVKASDVVRVTSLQEHYSDPVLFVVPDDLGLSAKLCTLVTYVLTGGNGLPTVQGVWALCSAVFGKKLDTAESVETVLALLQVMRVYNSQTLQPNPFDFKRSAYAYGDGLRHPFPVFFLTRLLTICVCFSFLNTFFCVGSFWTSHGAVVFLFRTWRRLLHGGPGTVGSRTVRPIETLGRPRSTGAKLDACSAQRRLLCRKVLSTYRRCCEEDA